MNIKARMNAVGEPTGSVTRTGVQIGRVYCVGCGEAIRSDQDLSGMQYVKTKRGTELFFHSECASRVWKGVKNNGTANRKRQ